MRHFHRYREIAVAFSRNGFGYFIKELGLHEIISLPKRLFTKNPKDIHTKTTGERIRLFLEDLGPTFIKLGQISSTRPDLFSQEIISELEKLQDHVSPFSFSEVKEIIAKELGVHEISEIFDDFDEIPLGSASIGQVHRARLKTGERVAVKIQRPNIEQDMRTDLEILQELARLAEARLQWAATYHMSDVLDEFSKALLAELDYYKEGRNAERIAKQFKNDQTIQIPNVIWDYSTKKVLTMEYVDGIKMNEVKHLKQKGFDTEKLAERIIESMLHQMLVAGFFHGDPHPGNVAVTNDDKIVYMDFGMVGKLSSQMKSNFASLIIAMMRQNSDGVVRAIIRMGAVPENVDMELLKADIELLKDKYLDVPLSHISLGEAVNDLFSIAQHHSIHIPSDLTLVGKSLLTMEGLVEKLDPEVSIMNIAEPFGRKLVFDKYRPDQLAKGAIEQITDFWDIFVDAPKQMRELGKILNKGKIPIEVDVPRVDIFLRKLDQISNRLSFSIVLLAFSIIMVGLIIGSAIINQESLLWDVPAIEIGFIIAVFMFIWLLYSIIKSGRF
ncbi:ABC1 kinase family protein [Alkalihalobacillus trypoxylicola]|uniref:ABC transporter n=1 Tax=Alkalihalobacillus trypoxylicola TaxID=519424 RepID=A0A161PW45_9BACI|nr:AarF/ABC1/UbiB kinase family protein [Alkalihalobacillus trypoxylicola]KYG26000.1 ABC transporter [Alkalihalobacillus trypoxylicola]